MNKTAIRTHFYLYSFLFLAYADHKLETDEKEFILGRVRAILGSEAAGLDLEELLEEADEAFQDLDDEEVLAKILELGRVVVITDLDRQAVQRDLRALAAADEVVLKQEQNSMDRLNRLLYELHPRA